MKHNNNCEQKVFFFKNADYQYLYHCDCKPDPKLVKLFKSKSLLEDKAIAEVRASIEET